MSASSSKAGFSWRKLKPKELKKLELDEDEQLTVADINSTQLEKLIGDDAKNHQKSDLRKVLHIRSDSITWAELDEIATIPELRTVAQARNIPLRLGPNYSDGGLNACLRKSWLSEWNSNTLFRSGLAKEFAKNETDLKELLDEFMPADEGAETEVKQGSPGRGLTLYINLTTIEAINKKYQLQGEFGFNKKESLDWLKQTFSKFKVSHIFKYEAVIHKLAVARGIMTKQDDDSVQSAVRLWDKVHVNQHGNFVDRLNFAVEQAQKDGVKTVLRFTDDEQSVIQLLLKKNKSDEFVSSYHIRNHCELVIKCLAKLKTNFKIGITTDSDQRLKAHIKGGWQGMIVVYKAHTVEEAGAYEMMLIQHGKFAHGDKCTNDITKAGEGVSALSTKHQIPSESTIGKSITYSKGDQHVKLYTMAGVRCAVYLLFQ